MTAEAIETPIEILEAQRRVKASQTEIKGLKPQIVTGTITDALGSLKKTLDTVKLSKSDAVDARRDFLAVSRLRDNWNAPRRHSERTSLDGNAKEWNACFQKLKKLIGTGFTVALVGTRGPGKTQIAVELMREATLQLNSAYYCTAMDYFMRIKDCFQPDRKERQEDAQRFFAKPKLLVIDEVNVRSDSAWEDNMLADLIGKRYNGLLDTVLISNETAKKFEESIGPSIIDRLNETGGIVECTWRSFRA